MTIQHFAECRLVAGNQISPSGNNHEPFFQKREFINCLVCFYFKRNQLLFILLNVLSLFLAITFEQGLCSLAVKSIQMNPHLNPLHKALKIESFNGMY